MSRIRWPIAASLLILSIGVLYVYGRSIWVPAVAMAAGARTVDEVVAELGEDARRRLQPHFDKAGLVYPPSKLTILAIKDSAEIELWVGPESAPTYLHTYPIQALSGVAGPKLKEGDRQVPEGLYAIEGLNPNSRYHLSLKLNYPNEFDLHHARAEGRSSPGTNIFIHGKSVSVGCLAMGDAAVEEIFVLVADIGRSNVDVVIAPSDPRVAPLAQVKSLSWTSELYEAITDKFGLYLR